MQLGKAQVTVLLPVSTTRIESPINLGIALMPLWMQALSTAFFVG
jgi:hypothetical protein